MSKAQVANDDFECITTRVNTNLSVFDNDIFQSLDDYDISIVISPAFGTAVLRINSGNPRIQYRRTSFVTVGDTLVYTLTNITSGEVDSATVYISFRGEADWDGLPSEVCQSEEEVDLTSLTTTGGIWILGNDTVTSVVPKDLIATDYEIVYVVGSEECMATDTSSFIIVDSVDASFTGLENTYCAEDQIIVLSTLPKEAGGEWYFNELEYTTESIEINSLAKEVYHTLEYRITTSCEDRFIDSFLVSEKPNATWDHFEDSSFCKYAESISLNTLNGRLQSSTVSGSWFLDNDELTDRLVFQNLNLDRAYQLIFKAGVTTGCESTDSQLININEGDSFETITNTTCGNTTVLDVTKSLNTLWTGSSENLVIEEYSDSIVFVNASYGNSSVRLVEVEEYKCPIVTEYNLYFEQQAEQIDLGSDIHLSNGATSFQIDAGSIPAGYDGEWYFDPTALSVSNELNTAIEVEVLESDTTELIWELESSVCLSVSDTIKVSKNQLLISGGISPNDDGLNDYFTVLGAPEGDVSLSIINRWGQVVFESEDYKNEWNGTNQNDKILPADTYYYTLDFENGTTSKGKLIIRK